MDDPQVSYSLKEVLERLEGKIDDLASRIDREFVHLENRVSSLETWRNRITGAVGILTVIVVPLAFIVIARLLASL